MTPPAFYLLLPAHWWRRPPESWLDRSGALPSHVPSPGAIRPRRSTLPHGRAIPCVAFPIARPPNGLNFERGGAAQFTFGRRHCFAHMYGAGWTSGDCVVSGVSFSCDAANSAAPDRRPARAPQHRPERSKRRKAKGNQRLPERFQRHTTRGRQPSSDQLAFASTQGATFGAAACVRSSRTSRIGLVGGLDRRRRLQSRRSAGATRPFTHPPDVGCGRLCA